LVVGIINGNTAAREMTTASTLAQDKMEEIRRQTYSGIPASDTTTTEGYNSISGFPAFKRITQIQVNNPAASMKLVTITVLWKNDTRSTSLTTIVSR
jgi:hypothetical protein